MLTGRSQKENEIRILLFLRILLTPIGATIVERSLFG